MTLSGLWQSGESEIVSRIKTNFTAADLRPLHEWARDNVTVGSWSPWPGKLSFDHTPWLIHPMTAARHATCHKLTLVAAAAGGKSTVGELFLAWLIPNDPGFTVWYCPNGDMTKEFAETRIGPFLNNVPAVTKFFPQDRHKKRTESIIFPHMAFLMLPANESSAQTKHIRYVFKDETWMYDPGISAQIDKRTTKFAHNRKIFEFATGSILGDETDQSFAAGTKRDWQFKCPKCSTWHTPFFSPERLDVPGGVRWAAEAKLQTGVYDFNIVRKTTEYECPNCKERFKPNESNAYQLNREGKYTGPEEIQAHESYHWSAIVSDFRLLGDFAVEFLLARAAIRRGSTALLQEFTQKREALAWNAAVVDDEPTNLVESSYMMGDPVPEAEASFLTVDVQKSCLWAVIRDWAMGPRSWLVWAGEVQTWDELRSLQIKFNIADECTLVDSGYFTDVVYGQCCRFGWKAIKGEKAARGFEAVDPETETKIYVPVIKANGTGIPLRLPVDAKYKECELYRISEERTAESWHLFRTGRASGWTLAKNTPQVYKDQSNCKQRRMRQDKRTGQTILEWITVGTAGDHLPDCERYQIAAAWMAGIMDPPISSDDQSQPVKE